MTTMQRGGAVLLLGVALLAGGGCTPLEEGFQEGVQSGLSAALAALIEIPITAFVNNAINPGGGE